MADAGLVHHQDIPAELAEELDAKVTPESAEQLEGLDSAVPSGAGRPVSIVTPAGQEVCRLNVGASGLTGSSLKELVAASEGTPVVQQRLLKDDAVLADDEVIPTRSDAEEAMVVTLLRLPPSRDVYISGGQHGCVTVSANGNVQPGPRFKWRMATVREGEFTFQAGEGPHEGKYLSALPGEGFTADSNLVVSGTADIWVIATRPADIFYNWNRRGPYAMGICHADRQLRFKNEDGWNAYWRWQDKSYHLAPKKGDDFHGDEAYWIELADTGEPAVNRDDANDKILNTTKSLQQVPPNGAHPEC